MRRRTLLGTTGSTLGFTLAGCLGGPKVEEGNEDDDGREAMATRSFDLPTSDPIEGFEVRIDDAGIGIATLGYESPA